MSPEFRYAIVQLENAFRPTPAERELLIEEAKLMGKTTLFSATEATNCLAFLGQCFNVEESIANLADTLDLAVAAQLSLEDAAKEMAGLTLPRGQGGAL